MNKADAVRASAFFLKVLLSTASCPESGHDFLLDYIAALYIMAIGFL
jgi:hypothetical protein